MFANDTNLIYNHSSMQKLFSTMNKELASINQWFNSKFTISNHVIERQEFIKFLGVLLDENLNWKEHIKYTEKEIAKNLGSLYQATPFLDRNTLLAL